MSKKIKRKPTGMPYVDPMLDKVDEDRAMEFDIDEETKEIIIVHHYRRKWGDEMDADIDHIYTIEEAGELISVLVNMIETVKNMDEMNMVAIRDALLVEKSTPTPIEGNPMQGPNAIEGK
jgi:hypothetical protein